MGNLIKLASINESFNNTQENLMPQKKAMERTKAEKNESFSDIYEIRQLSIDFNKASLESKKESIAYIRQQMQDIMQDIRLSGTYIITDMPFERQVQARQLIES